MKELILAFPRGFCAGVVRAIDTVDLAIEKYGTPLYVRKEIVHNQSVVEKFKARGVIFIEDLNEAPENALVIFSAHGVSPSVRKEAQARKLRIIDATCPLVTKVHSEVHKYKRMGYAILLIGHQNHDEVEGTMGEAPDLIQLVETVEDANTVVPSRLDKIVVLTQTTLSVDEARSYINILKTRFPQLETPPKDDICYATQNRQDAVRHLVNEGVDLVLVVGSQNSSNSKRLCELAQTLGVESYLIDSTQEISDRWLSGKTKVGVTAGASAPEYLVNEVIETFEKLDFSTREIKFISEDVSFTLPPELQARSTALPMS